MKTSIQWMQAAGAIAIAAAGIGAGYFLARAAHPSAGMDMDMSTGTAGTTGVSASSKSEPDVLYWYDPMVPDQHFDKPGKSPFMDMQLVPKYAAAGGDASDSGVAIASGVRRNLGLRTVKVERGRLASAVEVPGNIVWNRRLERVVSARVDAIVERLYIKAPYDPVRAGQPLARILAPEWSSALAEARALERLDSQSARELRAAARARLRVLGVPAGAGNDGRITLAAPVKGVVSTIGVGEGEAVRAGTLMFRINGTETVWLEAAVPQAAVAGIVAGTHVEARVDSLPGRRFEGEVEALLPEVDTGNRTQRARIVIENPDGLLAPGQFASVSIAPDQGSEQVLVPSAALVGGGVDARVIVLGEDDRFHPVRVTTGRSGKGMTEILEGLEGGERVVASGQFLIDSEASLSGALDRLDDAPDGGTQADDNSATHTMPMQGEDP